MPWCAALEAALAQPLADNVDSEDNRRVKATTTSDYDCTQRSHGARRIQTTILVANILSPNL
jgi:hypothetical protein